MGEKGRTGAGRSIKIKPEADKTVKEAGNRTVKTAPRMVKTSPVSSQKVKTQAIMMQESGGRGTDPMQASECPYNTQYPNTPGGVHNLNCKQHLYRRRRDMHMSNYNKITALYSRLSVGDEDRDGGESNSIQNQKIFLENYARGQHLTNIRHYIDDDESGRFFDRSAYSRMIEDVESGKIGVCIMKDLTRWGRDYLQVGNAMEIFRRNNVRFIAVNNGIDSENPDTLEFAPFINIMSEWYAKDISKKVKTGIKTKGMSGKPVATEAPYGYIKDPDNRDFWIIDEEAAEVVRLIFRLFLDGKNRNQSGTNRSDKEKDGQAALPVRPKCFLINCKLSL